VVLTSLSVGSIGSYRKGGDFSEGLQQSACVVREHYSLALLAEIVWRMKHTCTATRLLYSRSRRTRLESLSTPVASLHEKKNQLKAEHHYKSLDKFRGFTVALSSSRDLVAEVCEVKARLDEWKEILLSSRAQLKRSAYLQYCVYKDERKSITHQGKGREGTVRKAERRA
jgi:hypothetical protein